MADEQPKKVTKSIDKPFFGSQETPTRESVSAPKNTNSSTTRGKPRPSSSD